MLRATKMLGATKTPKATKMPEAIKAPGATKKLRITVMVLELIIRVEAQWLAPELAD